MAAPTCPKCGSEVRARGSIAFCTKCKSKVTVGGGGGGKGLLFGVLGLLVAGGIIAGIVVAMGPKEEPPPPPPKGPKYPPTAALDHSFKREDTEYTIHKFAMDRGEKVELYVFLAARPKSALNPDHFKLEDGTKGEEVEGLRHFDHLIRSKFRGADTRILEFRVPNDNVTMLVTEHGDPATKVLLHRPATPTGGGSLRSEMALEDWILQPHLKVFDDGKTYRVDLLFNGRSDAPQPRDLDIDWLPAQADGVAARGSNVPTLAARKDMPKYYDPVKSKFYFRWRNVPRDTKEFRIQIAHRGYTPGFVSFRPSDYAVKTKIAEKPPVKVEDVPPEKRLIDPDTPPLEALARLKEIGGADAGKQALPFLHKGIRESIGRGVEAWKNGKWLDFEKHFHQAAQLTRHYSTDHARALVQSVLSLRRETRMRIDELLRGVHDDSKAGRKDQAKARIKTAIQDPVLSKMFPGEIGKLEQWLSSPPADIDKEVDRWAARFVGNPGTCGDCKGIGEKGCDDCTGGGLVEADCPRCKAAGKIACPLCAGSGTINHAGYVGWVMIDLIRNTKITFKDKDGRTRTARVPAQKLTYDMRACDGRGQWRVDFHSQPYQSRKENRGSTTQTCQNFWDEMKRWVFNGRADIYVPDTDGKTKKKYSKEAARRLLSDYGSCKDGHIPCDRCAAKKKTTCPTCSGGKKSSGACDVCSGGGKVACGQCYGFGSPDDFPWLKDLVSESGLEDALGRHAADMGRWLGERTRLYTWRLNLRQQLKAALAQQDPKAEVHKDFVRLKCGACKGRGGSCGECWGSGKREFFAGSLQYEPYSVAAQLLIRLPDFDPQKAGAPPNGTFTGPVAKTPNWKPPEVKLEKDPNRRLDSAFDSLPDPVKAYIREGDAWHEEGKRLYGGADSDRNPSGWVQETYKSIAAFQKAMTAYATAQETLDSMGLEVPKALLKTFRTNFQALVMARKHAP